MPSWQDANILFLKYPDYLNLIFCPNDKMLSSLI